MCPKGDEYTDDAQQLFSASAPPASLSLLGNFEVQHQQHSLHAIAITHLIHSCIFIQLKTVSMCLNERPLTCSVEMLKDKELCSTLYIHLSHAYVSFCFESIRCTQPLLTLNVKWSMHDLWRLNDSLTLTCAAFCQHFWSF